MTSTVPINVIKQLIKLFKFFGTPSSIMLTSFENRFTILPIGVVSKNDIGQRSIFFNINTCKFFAPLTTAYEKIKFSTHIDKPWPMPSPP